MQGVDDVIKLMNGDAVNMGESIVVRQEDEHGHAIAACLQPSCVRALTEANGADMVALADGDAEHLGDGIYILHQEDEAGEAQPVVLQPSDIRALHEACMSAVAS